MSRNEKNLSSTHSTSIVASTLMQKMILGQVNFFNQNQQINDPIEQISISKRKIEQPANNIHTKNRMVATTSIMQPQFKLNLQYHHPVQSQQRSINKLIKIKNNSRLKQLKQIDPCIAEERESKILRHLRKNLVSLYGGKNKSTQRSPETMMKTQSDEQLTLHHNKNNSNVIEQKNMFMQRQKSPAKVSVNFELYFPKQKLRTTINHSAAKTHTRRSMNMHTPQVMIEKQLFRIKKSSKSISLHQQNQKNIIQISHDPHQLQKQRERFHEQILVSLRRNSATKYIEKIQKFKKYKDNKINRQPLFGLNVTQAEYHESKCDNDNRKIKQKIPLQDLLKVEANEERTITNQSEEQQRDKYNIDDQSCNYHQELTMNLTIPQCQNLNLNCNPHLEDPESKITLHMQKSQPAQNQKEKKCPSQHKLVSKSVFTGGISQTDNNKKCMKVKSQQQSWNRGVDKVFKGKLMNMLNCLDVVLNAYCCKMMTQENENQLNQIFANKSALIQAKMPDVQCINKLSANTHSNSNLKVMSQNHSMTLTLSQIPSNLLKLKDKFLYFVGGGNNKNLIRSIMKKRGWWNQTQKIQEANFVWTQLKVGSILDKQQKMSQRIIEEPDSWNFKARQADNQQIKLLKTTKSKINIQQTQKYQQIFHRTMLPVYYKKITQKQKQYQHLRSIPTPSVIHNHYDANYMLGNKKALFYNIIEYCKHKKLNPYEFIPMTFHIRSIFSQQFKSYLKISRKFKSTLWIVKPGENSNRGNGIFVEKCQDKIRKHIQKNADQNHSFIVQRYMKHIFLYNKRKFDIRVYMLMVTIGGITKFFWYEEGYIRTSSEIYNTDDITDLFVHLTNDAIQSKNDTYSKYEKGNKVSFTEFQKYLDINHTQEKYSVSQLNTKMKAIAKTVVKATYSKLDKSKKVNGFQLFGLDFLIDKHFAPWLLQVNTNPCLELSSPVLERLIPRMLQNVFRLSLDPIYRPTQNISRHSSYFLYDNLLEKNKFQLIFDGLFDNDFQWEEICQQQKNVVYEDEDQVFQSNGVQMEVAD